MGMYVYDGKKVQHFRYGDGMASGQVLDILINQGNYWLATTDGFVHYTNNNFINYNINQQKLGIRKVFKSPRGDLIVSPISGRSSNYEYGLYKYNGLLYLIIESIIIADFFILLFINFSFELFINFSFILKKNPFVSSANSLDAVFI